MGNSIAQASVACAPIRAEATDRSEMVNQLLIGETANMLDETELWIQIIKHRDGYKGWVNKNELFIFLEGNNPAFTLAQFNDQAKPSHFQTFRARNLQKPNQIILVPPGAPIVHNTEKATVSYLFGEFEIIDFLSPLPTNNLIATALSFLGTPYLWGGLSSLGIDCSGFTQTVAALHGLKIPRDASQQAKMALPLKPDELLHKVNASDLLFFNPSKSGNISHVGFYLGNGVLLHASGCVRIDSLLEDHATTELSYNIRYGQSLCSYLPLIS